MTPKLSEIKRHPERSVPEQTAAILAAGRVAHLAFIEQEQPFAIPFGYHFDAAQTDVLYLHGSRASRAINLAACGVPISVTVTLVDGLVYSKSAMYHSINYRSVVCFGRGREVSDFQRQRTIYREMIQRYFPGRTAGRDYKEPTDAELAATIMVEVAIEETSAKARQHGPAGPFDNDPDTPGTCGVIPL
jgi:nitroimidazol reductase NimA-like FMN-containing flavoprotein (pyridoxamine 5'-phosphate oxidase superfamily)